MTFNNRDTAFSWSMMSFPTLAHHVVTTTLFREVGVGTTIERFSCVLMLVAGLSAAPSGPARGDTISAEVVRLGTLDGINSEAHGVSDGAVVVGSSCCALLVTENQDMPAFRWTVAGDMSDLGVLLGGDSSVANAVSADGSVVVGYSYVGGRSVEDTTPTHAFRWTQAGGMADLGVLPGDSSSSANAVSADGSTVVGMSEVEGSNGAVSLHAFRWTQAGGMIDLGTLGGKKAAAHGVSADGSVVVGESGAEPEGTDHAFRWTQAGGMADLGVLPGDSSSMANAVSADGLVVVGYSYSAKADAAHAFRWTEADGMIDLGVPPGARSSVANAVSADGSVIVGDSTEQPGGPTHPFRWTQAEGIKDLKKLLVDAGINMTGINLDSAEAVSENGKYIVGEGVFDLSGFFVEDRRSAYGEGYIVCYGIEGCGSVAKVRDCAGGSDDTPPACRADRAPRDQELHRVGLHRQ